MVNSSRVGKRHSFLYIVIVACLCCGVLPTSTRASSRDPERELAQYRRLAPTLEQQDPAKIHFRYPARPKGSLAETNNVQGTDLVRTAPQTASESTRIFLPLIRSASSLAQVLGEKPVLDVLISDMSELVDELAFSSSEQQSLNQIMASERDGVQTLNAEASAITSNPNTSREEKQRQLEAIGYNDRLRALLRTSQADLQQHLGAEHYAELLSWLERSWQHLRDQHDALGQNDAYLTRTSANATSLPTCPTFTVFAQRSTDTDYSAGLPDLYLLLANRGIQYTAGYTNTTVYSVTIRLNANIAANVRIDDLGPHNINDNYWNTSTDPLHPRRAFKNAPHGKPEAQLAYFQNFNGGRNEFGQIVTSPAGIVVSQQVANQLGLAANGWVDVSFPWDCVPPSGTIPNPLEDAWGGEQPWSILTGQAVNPGTGNYLSTFIGITTVRIAVTAFLAVAGRPSMTCACSTSPMGPIRFATKMDDVASFWLIHKAGSVVLPASSTSLCARATVFC